VQTSRAHTTLLCSVLLQGCCMVQRLLLGCLTGDTESSSQSALLRVDSHAWLWGTLALRLTFLCWSMRNVS